MKKMSRLDRQADREHVVRPDEQRVERDADRRDRDRLVAEDRLAREDRQHLRDDPHRGQDHDVDLGVAEEPEDVLVEQRAAAVGRVEEVRSGLAVEEHHRQPRRQHRQHDHEHPAVGDHRPAEERDAHPGHPRRAHVVDRDDEVDRAGERRRSRGCAARGSRGPGRCPASAASRAAMYAVQPVRRSAALREEAQVQDDPAEQEQPVRERVQPREGHVARADLQRHEEVPEAREERDDDEEDHRRAVDRHDLVVRVLRQERLVGRRELRADQQRQHSAHREEDERRAM